MFRYRTVLSETGNPVFMFTDGPVCFVRFLHGPFTNTEIDIESKQFMKDVPKLLKSKKYITVQAPESLARHVSSETVALV